MIKLPLFEPNTNGKIQNKAKSVNTVCPRSGAPFYTVTYYIKWDKTLWTYCTVYILYKYQIFILYSLVLYKKKRGFLSGSA